ncbi:MAG: hypothetical protein J7L45_00280, partial [Candidatus Aenigmarchaeota archaeon]|nr:hypothetical protein [Candidatus Aenigmarchaeota archaeon]
FFHFNNIMTVKYILKPKENILNDPENFDIIEFGNSLLGLIHNYKRIVGMKESVKNFTIDMKTKEIYFEMSEDLDKNIYEFLGEIFKIDIIE